MYKTISIHPKMFINIGPRFIGIEFKIDTPLTFLVLEHYPTYVTYNNNEYTNNINKLVDYSEQERLSLHVKENSKHIQAPRIDIKVGTIIKIKIYRY